MYRPDSESLQFVPLFRANNPAVVMRPVSAASSSACVAVAAEALATRRMSHPGSIAGLMRRKIVLNRRRTLLRTTADPRRLPVEMYRPDSESLQFVPLFRANNPAAVMRPVSAASSSVCVTVAAVALATRRMSHPGSISPELHRFSAPGSPRTRPCATGASPTVRKSASLVSEDWATWA